MRKTYKIQVSIDGIDKTHKILFDDGEYVKEIKPQVTDINPKKEE